MSNEKRKMKAKDMPFLRQLSAIVNPPDHLDSPAQKPELA